MYFLYMQPPDSDLPLFVLIYRRHGVVTLIHKEKKKFVGWKEIYNINESVIYKIFYSYKIRSKEVVYDSNPWDLRSVCHVIFGTHL